MQRVEIKNTVLTSALDIQNYVSHKISTGGGGWFKSNRREYSRVEKMIETVNSMNLVLSDFR
jgi:hypothetical protein